MLFFPISIGKKKTHLSKKRLSASTKIYNSTAIPLVTCSSNRATLSTTLLVKLVKLNLELPKGGIWTCEKFPSPPPTDYAIERLNSLCFYIAESMSYTRSSISIDIPSEAALDADHIVDFLLRADAVDYVLDAIGLNANLSASWVAGEIRDHYCNPVHREQIHCYRVRRSENMYAFLRRRTHLEP